MERQHVRRHAGISDYGTVSRHDNQTRREQGARPHRTADFIHTAGHAQFLGHAPAGRRKSMDRHRAVAGIRPFNLLFHNHRCRAYHQDVGTGIRATDARGHILRLSLQHVDRQRSCRAVRIAGNRQFAFPNHILFSAGHRGVLHQRSRRGRQKPHGTAFRENHRSARPCGGFGSGLQFLIAVVHGRTFERHDARRFGTCRLRHRKQRAGFGLCDRMELR